MNTENADFAGESLHETMRGDAHAGSKDTLFSATGQAFYSWDVATDRLEWSRNFASLAGLDADEQRHLTGRGFETMVGGQSQETRFGIIYSTSRIADSGEVVPYQCVYVISPDPQGRKPVVWLEDSGVWYPDPEGRPIRAEGSVRVINDRRQREEDLRRKSDFDDLTGLPNRRSLEGFIEKTVRLNQQEASVSTFLLLALERFELVNRLYGFETGDQVLKRCGEILRTKLRAGDVICRFSGAKYGIILNNCPPAEIYDAANRLIRALSSDVIETPKGYVAINALVGACFLPKHATTPAQAFQAAFSGLRLARSEKMNRVGVYFHDAEAERLSREASAYSRQVVEGIQANRVVLAYQPVVDSSGRPVFQEALLRLQKGDGGLVNAGEFIGIVERLGLVRVADKCALDLCLETLRRFPEAVLSINVSRDTILDPDWLSQLSLGLSGIPDRGSRLIVEITESMAVSDPAETRRFVQNVKALGCMTALDDFGVGYTSFSSLRELPVDILKIDGSFGRNFAGDPDSQVFVRALVSLARHFGMKTVVEWVEDEKSALMLLEAGVDYLQGHHFGAPLTVSPWKDAADLADVMKEAQLPAA